MPNHTAEIVVVGGGGIGINAAVNLALMGAGNVIPVEGSHLAGGARGLSGQMVRERYLHPVLVRMAWNPGASSRTLPRSPAATLATSRPAVCCSSRSMIGPRCAPTLP